MSKSIIAALALSTLAVVGFTGVAQAQAKCPPIGYLYSRVHLHTDHTAASSSKAVSSGDSSIRPTGHNSTNGSKYHEDHIVIIRHGVPAALAFQVVGPAWAAADDPAGTTIVAGGPTDQLCIWQQIKTGAHASPKHLIRSLGCQGYDPDPLPDGVRASFRRGPGLQACRSRRVGESKRPIKINRAVMQRGER